MAKHTPKNNNAQLYKALTRLLSGPIVNKRRQLYHRERRRDLNKYNFKSASGQTFKRTHYNPYQILTANILNNQNRIERYAEFDEMEYDPIIQSALDIYAGEITASSRLDRVLKISCPNEEIRVVLEELFYNVLNLDSNLYPWVRKTCKTGDFFLYLDIDEQKGITHVIGLPSAEIERLEGEDKTNPKYVQFQWNTGNMTFENWMVAHFRILGADQYAPYGTSVLEPARRIFRQVELMENAMIAYRVVRATERRLIYAEMGGIPDEEIPNKIEELAQGMKKNQVIDHLTGRSDLRYNPFSVEEDIIVPKRGDLKAAEFDILKSGEFVGVIDDVVYLKDKLFAALKIPQSYLFRGEGGEEDKGTLSQKDIMFARTIQRIQRSIEEELTKIAVIHLFTLGYTGEDLTSFRLSLNNPSKIAEMQELETLRVKFEVASSMSENMFSRRWMAQNIFNMSQKEFERNELEMFHDQKFKTRLEVMAQEAANEATAGEFGGDLGEISDKEMAPLDQAEGGLGELGDNPNLMVEPPAGKRDDLPPQWKGKHYTPEPYDKRKNTATKKHFRDQSGYNYTQPTERNLFKGYQDIKPVGRAIYEEREERFNSLNADTKALLESLEKSKKVKKDETQ